MRSFDPDKLRAYLSRNYRAPDMVVAAAGAVDHKAVLAQVEEKFGELHRARRAGAAGRQIRRRHHASNRAISSRCISRSRCRACRSGHPELYSLQVFTTVLGGGMSSRLFQEVREKRGLCYSIYAFHMPYSDTGMFGLYAGTDQSDAPELMQVVVDEIADATATINETEINRAKAQMKAGLLMALESSGARAEQLARQILAYGRPIPLDEIVAKIDAVTRSERPRGRTALMRRSRPAIAALGPGRGLDSAAAIAESLGKQAA